MTHGQRPGPLWSRLKIKSNAEPHARTVEYVADCVGAWTELDVPDEVRVAATEAVAALVVAAAAIRRTGGGFAISEYPRAGDARLTEERASLTCGRDVSHAAHRYDVDRDEDGAARSWTQCVGVRGRPFDVPPTPVTDEEIERLPRIDLEEMM